MPPCPRPRPRRVRATSTVVAALAVAACLGSIAAQEAPTPPPSPPPVMPPPAVKGPRPAKPAQTARPEAPAAQGPVRIVPKTWPGSTYSFEGRVQHSVIEVTVKAPPAYQESFDFWIGRIKGNSRTEMIQHLTTTRETTADGLLPFRRQVSRYFIDMSDRGEVKAASGPFTRDVMKLVWEGAFDPRGNVTDMKRVAGPESMDEVDRLAFPLLDLLFPALDDTREMKPGDTFIQEVSMRLPSRLAIAGLDATAARLTRRYTLREVSGQEARFDVAVIYAADPKTPPTAARTTCAITGGGEGKAVFDLAEGVFVSADQMTRMMIDVEAPLRRLPDQAPDFDPGTAASHMELSVSMSGKLKVSHLFEPAPQAERQPAPQDGTAPR